MPITRVIIENFKGLSRTELEFRDGLNIIVGDNEVGKSTVLEAINLGLTRQLNRRDIRNELHPFLFHQNTVKSYIQKMGRGEKQDPPAILIEIYFANEDAYASHQGINNSRRDDCPGVSLRVELDDNYGQPYSEYIADTNRLRMIPVEFYHVVWRDFSANPLTPRTTPVRPALIDPSALTNTYAANRYVLEVARDFLSDTQQVNLALAYRQMRERFLSDTSVIAINDELFKKKGIISDHVLSVGLDMISRSSWEAGITPHLDLLPLSLTGKGEQTSIKVRLELEAHERSIVLLMEEPENHLSHANLSQLLEHIANKLEDKQLIVTTHSSFVLNKLGIDTTIMFDGNAGLRLGELPADTRNFFMRLPGHDTLRMVLAKRSILVEGPSDELLVQKAYVQKYRKMPLQDGVEVIAVSGLSFKRFLDIAKLLSLDVCVVTDNDGNPDRVKQKYENYETSTNIRIHYSQEKELRTLENHLVTLNDLAVLNGIFGTACADKNQLLENMKANKTERALALFESDTAITIPQHISDAIR